MSKKIKITVIILAALIASAVAVIINLPSNEIPEDKEIFSTLEDENTENSDQTEGWTENTDEFEDEDIEKNIDTEDSVSDESDELEETSPPESENESTDSNADVDITYTETPQEPESTTKPTSTPSSSTSSNTDQNTEPEPDYGEENGAGQIYDPAFGWITPSEAVGENVDNDGDVNTQVGSMS